MQGSAQGEKGGGCRVRGEDGSGGKGGSGLLAIKNGVGAEKEGGEGKGQGARVQPEGAAEGGGEAWGGPRIPHT